MFDAQRVPFQSTLPARGATALSETGRYQAGISIHAPRTGSDITQNKKTARVWLISIHAPRTGSDGVSAQALSQTKHNFNPRSPHGERLIMRCMVDWLDTFQSTLPARGATAGFCIKKPDGKISIHAPRTGSDVIDIAPFDTPEFQSTLPARGATQMRIVKPSVLLLISIHAPRTGSDCAK